MIKIPDMHFWHHAYLTVECIYRSWERLTTLLQTATFPDCADKLYFPDLIEKIGTDSRLANNKLLRELCSQVKHYNAVARSRNALSHGDSSPHRELQFAGSISPVLDPSGKLIPKVDYSYADIRERIETLKDHYIRLGPAITAVKEFIENV